MQDGSPIDQDIEPTRMIVPRRKVTGMSAILLPFLADGEVDWDGFDRHVGRTLDAGLTPAVNMDTGYVNLIDEKTREAVLSHTKNVAGGKNFAAGAFVADKVGDKWNPDAYKKQIGLVGKYGGTAVIMQSFGLTSHGNEETADCYEQIAGFCDRFIAFELGEMFAPFGRIYDIETYSRIMEIPQCIGAKHSSLDRGLEWQRLALRNRKRPEFMVLTGNDLAIDMIMYGSDYLLGLSTFAPDAFALRDKLWEAGDPDFYELNCVLQFLGLFTFRPPVPAYKHSAAQFLRLRGWISSDRTHARAISRQESDKVILQNILEQLEKWV